ncbi:MAG TPA: bifunctional homocysteine S-methyltransferase/methylenetetrahydrofolate reductase [bacterium]|nr:bifunctional homocysteine S-methyltransferase/methylenetetrahydrofolate reductase [bacterium]
MYKRGIFINRCFDELNISNPSLIKEIHDSYISAGALLIETNTFTGSRPALAAHGLDGKVAEINRAGVKIARESAGERAFVAGSIGPISWTRKNSGGMTDSEMKSFFTEQIEALSDAGSDVILLETFIHLDELHIAYEAAREVSNKPVITQVSLKHLGEGEFEGLLPEYAAAQMENWGADVIGVNCCDGPQGVFEAIKRMSIATKTPLSAMPNAGLPQMVNGRLMYLASPEYFAEYARRYAMLGVALIGGCCGTTPEHIKEAKKYLKTMRPGQRSNTKSIVESISKPVSPIPPEQKSLFGAVIGKKFAISVEVDPPLGTDPSSSIDAAKSLKQLGVDAINIADGPRAMARMSPIALASLIKGKVGIETIVHYCCRDRNILGMQMDLIGASALGLHNVLVITGDPPKMGHYPEASAVFDVDSIGLIRFISNLNLGLDFAGRPIKQATKFLIGCGVNPGAIDIDTEVERFRSKIASGAEFAFSQPVYDQKMLARFLEKIKDLSHIPFFVGVLPLVSLRNAEFLHNEVPGMQIPKHILDKMVSAKSGDAQKKYGLEIARDIVSAAKGSGKISGAYIFPPLGRYETVEKILKGII